mgnify:CR=1 FL=1
MSVDTCDPSDTPTRRPAARQIKSILLHVSIGARPAKARLAAAVSAGAPAATTTPARNITQMGYFLGGCAADRRGLHAGGVKTPGRYAVGRYRSVSTTAVEMASW